MPLMLMVYPAPILRQTCQVVPAVTGETRQFASKLVEAMLAYDGAGIAAPQVGVPLRMIAIDAMGGKAPGGVPVPLVMVNPEIIARSDEIVRDAEGCLSFPGVMLHVERFRDVTVRFTALDGETTTLPFKGFSARAVQHELDHLDGRLLIDQPMSRMKRDMILKRMKRVAKQGPVRPKKLQERSAP